MVSISRITNTKPRDILIRLNRLEITMIRIVNNRYNEKRYLILHSCIDVALSYAMDTLPDNDDTAFIISELSRVLKYLEVKLSERKD